MEVPWSYLRSIMEQPYRITACMSIVERYTEEELRLLINKVIAISPSTLVGYQSILEHSVIAHAFDPVGGWNSWVVQKQNGMTGDSICAVIGILLWTMIYRVPMDEIPLYLVPEDWVIWPYWVYPEVISVAAAWRLEIGH